MTGLVARTQAGWLRLSGNLRGVIWITLGTVLFALNDAVIKYVGAKFSPFEMAFIRYMLGLALFAPLFLRMGVAGLRTGRLRDHFYRGVFAGLSQVGVYYAVIHLPLAEATAIAFSRMIWITVLAVLFLRERVGWRGWTATAVGFGGVLIMVRPGAVPLDPAVIVAILSAVGFAIALIQVTWLASTEPPLRILFYYQFWGATLFALPALFVWRAPIGFEWLEVGLIGVLTAGATFCFVRGYAAGQASVVGPMEYSRLIYAAFLGFFVFAEIPSLWTWAGAAVIIASTLYIARRGAAEGRRMAGGG